MAISLKHAFTSLKGDGTDPTQVQPSHWNANHNISLVGGNLVGRLTAGVGAAEEIPISSFMAGVLAAANAQALLNALGIGGFTTGDVKTSFSSNPQNGWLRVVGAGTIGDAASSATLRANADTRALYTVLWTYISNSYCPVIGGRGGSAALDFDAHKQIWIPELRGRSLIGLGASNAGGGPAWLLGQPAGENIHTLTLSEIPSHQHSNTLNDPSHQHSGQFTSVVYASTAGGAFTAAGKLSSGANNPNFTGMSITNAYAGGSEAHNTIHPSTGVCYHIKL